MLQNKNVYYLFLLSLQPNLQVNRFALCKLHKINVIIKYLSKGHSNFINVAHFIIPSTCIPCWTCLPCMTIPQLRPNKLKPILMKLGIKVPCTMNEFAYTSFYFASVSRWWTFIAKRRHQWFNVFNRTGKTIGRT